MALHPAAIRQVLSPFRVALTGGRSKMFISNAAESRKNRRYSSFGYEADQGYKKDTDRTGQNCECSTQQTDDSKQSPGLTTRGRFGECSGVPLPLPILVINSGSSSLKFSLLDPGPEVVLAAGIAERLGTDTADLKLVDLDGVKHEEVMPGADHRASLLRVIEILGKKRQFDVKAIGHRVVHGGENFRQAVLVTESVVRRIEELADLAPLHNPASVQGIRVATELFPDKPQVVVFDTAFHQSLPAYAFHYAIPYEYYEKYQIRRYGFHGTSHHYVSLQAAKLIGKPVEEAQFISAHLGNGCSAAAIRNGRSVDTTMGLTPLEGLIMGTRSGDVDPSLHLYLQEKEQRSLREITDEILTRRSGLLGVSGVSHDMRSVIAAADEGNPRARLAIEMFSYRLARSILALTASLSSVDALIFTGGIGENSAPVRARVLTHLAILRPELDQNLNEIHGKGADGRITSRSGLLCLVIATNEELMIARETALLIA
jgi:acetate kinase